MEEFWNALLRGLTPESTEELNGAVKGILVLAAAIIFLALF